AGGPSGGYPGLRAPAPTNYVEQLVRALAPQIEHAFALDDVALARAECSFSLTTLPEESLTPEQRVPHVDTTYPLQFALLHYLCEPHLGGTSFYRHRASGFEVLTADREPDYDRLRAVELNSAPPAPGYVRAGDDSFLRTGGVDARFNRVVIYRS